MKRVDRCGRGGCDIAGRHLRCLFCLFFSCFFFWFSVVFSRSRTNIPRPDQLRDDILFFLFFFFGFNEQKYEGVDDGRRYGGGQGAKKKWKKQNKSDLFFSHTPSPLMTLLLRIVFCLFSVGRSFFQVFFFQASRKCVDVGSVFRSTKYKKKR